MHSKNEESALAFLEVAISQIFPRCKCNHFDWF